MSMAALLDEDRRLIILRVLAEAEGYALNESLLERAVNRLGVGFVGRDQVRGLLAWLEGQRMLTVEKLRPAANQAELWVATLAKLGLEVAQGRPWPGIARPSPPAA